MTNDEMIAALEAANLALVEKISAQPSIALNLQLIERSWLISGYLDQHMRERIRGNCCPTPADAFASIQAVIAAMPSPEERDIRRFQSKLAEVIDLGNELGIDAEFVNPLIVMARNLASNALTHEAA